MNGALLDSFAAASYPPAMSAPRAGSILMIDRPCSAGYEDARRAPEGRQTAPQPAFALALALAACAHSGDASRTDCTLSRHWRMAEDGAIVYFANLTGPDDRFEEITLGISPNDPAYARELERIAATGRTLEHGGDLTVREEIACPARP